MPGHNQTGAGCVLGFANAFFTRWEEKNKKYTHSTVLVVASSSSCAEVSSTDSGFTSWLTVSITIMGMIGSFKSALKSLMYRLPLYISLGCNTTPQWNKEMACIRLFLFVLIAFFWICDSNPLLYFDYFDWFMSSAQCASIIQSNRAAQWARRLH